MYDNRKNAAEKDKRVCVAAIGSVTSAMSAQSALSSASIRSNVLKINSAKSGVGCAYGISFACNQGDNVKEILRSSGIRVKKYIEE